MVNSNSANIGYNAVGMKLDRFFQAARPRRLRTMAEFAQQEIVIPSGRFEVLHSWLGVAPDPYLTRPSRHPKFAAPELSVVRA